MNESISRERPDAHLPRFRDVFRTQGDMPFVAETRSAQLRFLIWLSELSVSACNQNSATPAFREGRVIREDKRGFIPGKTPRLLERLAIDPEQFVATAGRMLRQFGSAIGTPAHVTDLCVARQARYLRGMGAARALFEMRAA